MIAGTPRGSTHRASRKASFERLDSKTTMATLSSAERARYEDQGHLTPRFRLPAPRIAALRTALEATIARNPNIRPERLTSVHTPARPGKAVNGHAAFLEIATDSRLVDLVASVLGENIALWGCQAFAKPPGDGLEVPMHQDGQYWPIEPLATCTVWVAVDRADRENGCLRVIPGSHRERITYNHRVSERDGLVLNQEVDDPRAFTAEPVDVELEAGEVSLHDVHMVHGSNPNRSARRRGGLAIRYMPTTSWFRRDKPMTAVPGYPGDFASRPLWLVRGTDVCGRNDFEIGHDNNPR